MVALKRICLLLLVCLVSCRQETASGYLNRGNTYYSQGKYQDAAQAYRKAIQKEVRMGEAHYRYGLALVALNQPSKAIAPFRRALMLMPEHEDSRVQLGNILLSEWLKDPRRSKQGYDDVKALAQRALTSNPGSYGALRQMGYLELNQGDRAKALEYLNKALAAKPRDPDVSVVLARLHYDTDPQKSESILRDVVKAHPTFVPAYDTLYEYCIRQRRTADAEQVLVARHRALPKDSLSVLQLANHYTETGRAAEAKTLLEGMMANAADFPDRFIKAGDFYSARRDYASALAVYRRGSEAIPQERKTYETRIANVLLAQNDREGALRIFDSAIQRDESDLDARAAKAALWLDSGKPEMLSQAIRDLESIVKQQPNNGSFHFTLARAYLAKGDRVSARSHARDAARNDRSLVAARLMVAEIDLSENRPKEALPYAVEAMEMEPSNSRGHLLLVRALQLSGRIAEAKTELGLLLKSAPNFREAQIQQGYMLIDERKLGEAESAFRKLLRPGQDDSDAMAGIVQIQVLQKQPARALEEVKAEVARNPRATKMKLLLADLAVRSGAQALALEQYNDLAAQGVKNADIYMAVAQIHYRSGRLEEAVQALKQAQALAPAKTGISVTLGGIIEQTGRVDEARALYRKVLETDNQNATAMNNLAYSLAESGKDLDEALDLAKQAARLRPDPNFSDTLGWIYLKKNMHDSAVQIFRNLVDKQPENTTFRLHLGMALLAKGERPAARREFEQVLQKNPTSPDSNRIRSLLNQTGI